MTPLTRSCLLVTTDGFNGSPAYNGIAALLMRASGCTLFFSRFIDSNYKSSGLTAAVFFSADSLTSKISGPSFGNEAIGE